MKLILDWFCLSMRTHHVKQVTHGMCTLSKDPGLSPEMVVG